MYGAWISMEHYRLHTVENWPDSPAKEAALGAIRSALARLSCKEPAPWESECSVCRARRKRPAVLEMVGPSRVTNTPKNQAA